MIDILLAGAVVLVGVGILGLVAVSLGELLIRLVDYVLAKRKGGQDE